jgi:hypothetical protein
MGNLRVEKSAGDMYISAYTTNKFQNYISFWLRSTQSPKTCDALIELLKAMQKDNQERPQ